MKLDFFSYYLGMAIQAYLTYLFYKMHSQLINAVLLGIVAILILCFRNTKNV